MDLTTGDAVDGMGGDEVAATADSADATGDQTGSTRRSAPRRDVERQRRDANPYDIPTTICE
jgi:hypothetical protein